MVDQSSTRHASVVRFAGAPAADELRKTIERDGCCVVERTLTDATVDLLCEAIDTADLTTRERRARRGSMFAVRNVMRAIPDVHDIARDASVRRLVEPVLSDEAFVMRAILFDKTPDANWHVGWHQDTAIAVEHRHDVDGFGPWSMKADVQHVRPPASVLGQVLTVRLHLDGCDERSGALRVLPGWHERGFVEPESMAEAARTGGDAVCSVTRGDAVLIRPLTPHASSPAEQPSRRRVIHLEFAVGELPDGLQWMRASA